MEPQTKCYLLRPLTMFTSPAYKTMKAEDFDVGSRTSLAFVHITCLIQARESIDFWHHCSSKLRKA